MNNHNTLYKQYEESVVRRNILNWFDFEPYKKILLISGNEQQILECLQSKMLNVDTLSYDMLEKISKPYDYIIWFESLLCSQRVALTTDIISTLKNKLNYDGSLILCLNNKMAMGNWTGVSGIYIGKPYSFVQNESSYMGFSKPEIDQLLTKCKMGEIYYYYPFPDMYFPSSIYSEDFLPQIGDLREETPSYIGEGYHMFKESGAYDLVCKDNMFPYFSNSFLVVCKQ